MNSENSRTSKFHRPLRNISDKADLKKSDKYVVLSNFSIYYTWKHISSHTKTINLEYLSQRGTKNLN